MTDSLEARLVTLLGEPNEEAVLDRGLSFIRESTDELLLEWRMREGQKFHDAVKRAADAPRLARMIAAGIWVARKQAPDPVIIAAMKRASRGEA